MKRFLVAGFGVLLVVALGGHVAWLAWRDPLAALPPPDVTPVLTGSWVELHGDGLST